ncbi:hypothetical protein CRUP_017480 [Coryphaenoides rupestris]|nr:hypothetical protein CRUP_017480 [Coryphaenoides rupestris]
MARMFLAQLKLMDYSLLVGIHDVERAEQEEVESEDNNEGAEEEAESDDGRVGTPPDSPSNTLNSSKPLAPGEFDPTIDVYAIKSSDMLCPKSGNDRNGYLDLADPSTSMVGSNSPGASGLLLSSVLLGLSGGVPTLPSSLSASSSAPSLLSSLSTSSCSARSTSWMPTSRL